MSLLRHRNLLPLDAPSLARRSHLDEPRLTPPRALLLPLLWFWLCAGAISLVLFEPLRTPHPLVGEPVFWLLGWPLCSLILLLWRARRRAGEW